MRHILAGLFLIFSVCVYADTLSLKQKCINALQAYPSYFKEEALDAACAKVELKEGCASVDGEPIFHFDHKTNQPNAKNIMVISLIHGDETIAGNLGRFWIERLTKIDSRNNWRIIPVANPDGVKNNTRINANGVDLNRNFPTVDWTSDAHKIWEKQTKKNPRRFPGYSPGSEVETQCLVKHLDEYNPSFVISIHTPLNVLDFDGPKIKSKPQFEYLPWKTLGNFPGSLGRYLWVERAKPVLTTELKETAPKNSKVFEQLQDLIGTLVKADLK